MQSTAVRLSDRPSQTEVIELLASIFSNEWMTRAACRGRPDLFFGPHGERPQTRARREARARLVCTSCPVLRECRTHAHTMPEYGVWAGESEDDRAALGFDVPASLNRPSGR
jgi:WhiB family redox-sensing transcriptional regulator